MGQVDELRYPLRIAVGSCFQKFVTAVNGSCNISPGSFFQRQLIGFRNLIVWNKYGAFLCVVGKVTEVNQRCQSIIFCIDDTEIV